MAATWAIGRSCVVGARPSGPIDGIVRPVSGGANRACGPANHEFRLEEQLVVGDGGHSPNHAGAILPDALRWLWRD